MNTTETNRAAAIRFIEAFNAARWDDLPAVVARDFVLHHPMGGSMRLGPDQACDRCGATSRRLCRTHGTRSR